MVKDDRGTSQTANIEANCYRPTEISASGNVDGSGTERTDSNSQLDSRYTFNEEEESSVIIDLLKNSDLDNKIFTQFVDKKPLR